MEIFVIVIDDIIDNADYIKNCIERYTSAYVENKNIIYRVISFGGDNAYPEAKKYILSNQIVIDVIFADYQLGKGYGTDLFKLITPKFRIYKILHSETDRSLINTQDLINIDYHSFSTTKSKNEIDIHEALKKYENKILSIKLKGNNSFRDKYFNDLGKLTEQAKGEIGKNNSVKYYQAIFVESLANENIQVHYYDENTKTVQSFGKTTLTISGDFITKNLWFKRLNRKTAINLLWVSKIDIFNNIVEFISPDNKKVFLPFAPDKCFEDEVRPLINQIEKGTHPYFKE